jgi:hypothetical protein
MITLLGRRLIMTPGLARYPIKQIQKNQYSTHVVADIVESVGVGMIGGIIVWVMFQGLYAITPNKNVDTNESVKNNNMEQLVIEMQRKRIEELEQAIRVVKSEDSS